MPNPQYNDDMNKRHQGGVKAKKNKSGDRGSFHEKDAGFPGVPGKTHSKSFFGGANRLKIHPKSEGL